MNETIRQLVQLKESVGITEPSSMNFCVTDGRSVVAARCRSHPGQDPPSLYYALGSSFMYSADTKSYSMDSASEPDTVINRPAVPLLLCTFVLNDKFHTCPLPPFQVLVASEPVTFDGSSWKVIPKDHMLVVHPRCDPDRLVAEPGCGTVELAPIDMVYSTGTSHGPPAHE